MAHSKYEECMKTELDLFTVPRVQTSTLKTIEVPHKPIASLDNGSVIEFVVSPSQGDSYRDISEMFLSIRCRVVKEDNTLYKSTDTHKYSVTNNMLHSLFRQCTIYLGSKVISQQDNNYAYRSYLEQIINHNPSAIETHLEAPGLFKDTPGMMDKVDGTNVGLERRRGMVANSGEIELIGKVHCDMVNQEKLLLSNLDLRVVLSLQKPEFYMIEEAAKGTSKMQILDATLYINYVTVSPQVVIGHEQALVKANAYYPYSRVEVKTYTVGAGHSSLALDNVVMGQLPNFLLFCMVSNAAYVGTRDLNPYNLQNFNMTSFNMQVNGENHHLQPYTFDFKKKPNPLTMRAYLNLFRSTKMNTSHTSNTISKKFYDAGCFIMAHDLTSDRSAGAANCSNLLNQGTIRIEGRFGDPLPSTITCIVYCEYDSVLEIDRYRNVYAS